MTAGLRWALIASLAIAALALMGRATSILLLAFAAVLIANFFGGCAQLISRRVRIPRPWALALFLLFLATGMAGLGWLFAARIASQMDELTREIPRVVAQLREELSHYGWISRTLSELPSPSQLASAAVLQRVTGAFSSLLGALAGGAIVLVMALFLSADRRIYQRGILRLVPMHRRDEVLETMEAVSETLWQWMLVKLASMAVIGILTYIGLLIVGLPLAPTLALIAGLMSFIPNFGPILSSIPALLLGLSQSPATALQVLGVFLAAQVVESNLVTPILERRTLQMPPALTIAVQVLLGMLSGGLGVIVASPLLAAVMVVVERLYVEDKLGDDLSERTLPATVRSEAA